MKTIINTVISTAATVLMMAIAVDAVGQQQPPAKREVIPGSELMVPQERERYRQRMRGAKSVEEQEQIRAEHRKQMRERARLHGLQLPEPQKPTGEQK